MSFLIPFTPIDLAHSLSKREGEKKIGEEINLITSTLSKTDGKFVLIGIPEDIGPRANVGNTGAKNSWNSFLSKFLNMQSNRFISANEIIIAGEVSMEGIKISTNNISELRKEVETLDERVKTVISEIVAAGKTPIVIGGGHNNCYPIISSYSSPIQVLNVDPHADIRKKEGRHSGNGFTYALESGSLSDYFVLGLHEEYNSEYIFNKFENDNLNFLSFNEILDKSISVKEMVIQVKDKLTKNKIGLEIDLDSIKNMPVSARTPIGFTEEKVRKIILETSKNYEFHYIHICEGAPKNKKEELIVGKTIAYLVSDFIKCNS